jgi:hypothetical protein
MESISIRRTDEMEETRSLSLEYELKQIMKDDSRMESMNDE